MSPPVVTLFFIRRASPAVIPSGAAAVVTFPDDYPNSVKHFLLMGCLGFAIGSGVFLYLTIMRTKSSVTHSITFLVGAIGAMAYYAMWTGLGVEYKTIDKTPRVIFWGRYVEQLLTQPVSFWFATRVFAYGQQKQSFDG